MTYETENELVNRLAASVCAFDDSLDEGAVRDALRQESQQVQQGVEAIQATAAGASCRRWTTIECTFGDPPTDRRVAFQQREPIGWGGSRCYSIGPCHICFHYSCRLVAE